MKIRNRQSKSDTMSHGNFMQSSFFFHRNQRGSAS
jgi:hypothetical protein